MISFVIPAHNEERLLAETLDAIVAAARANALPHEIIVVDDESTDRTGEIARGKGARVERVSLRQISAARNAGARAARGDMLIFVDADTIVNEHVVAAAVAAMKDGAGGGGCWVRWDGPLPWWARLLAATTLWTMRIGRLAAGCFMFATRAAFEAAEGFDEQVYATEEVGFARRLKRHGRFVLLRESVSTSGRKLRTHSFGEIFRMVAGVALRGFGGVKDRRHLPLWYGERRHEE